MKNKHRQLETVMLAAALIAISGACLAYNLRTADSTELTASLAELAVYNIDNSAGAISDVAAANLIYRDTVTASATPIESPRSTELLPPIVTPPS